DHPGVIDVEVVWSRPKLALTNPQPAPARPSPDSPAPEGDPLFERTMHGRVHVVAADAPIALTAAELDELVPTMVVGLRICEAGERSAVQLSKEPPGLSWIGRWEVLSSDAPDASPCAVMRRLPTGWPPSALGSFPAPLPDELLVRFVPELPETAFTSPGKS